jgi:DNA-binding XRE family transcriptional regulator
MNSALDVRRSSVRDVLRLASKGDLSGEDFQNLCVQTQEILEMTDQEMADGMEVSRPTFNRWKNGKNLPHPIGQRALARWMTDKLAAKAKFLESMAKSSRGSGGGSGEMTPGYALAAKSR